MGSGTYVAIAIFLIGVIFHAGYSTARIAHLEEWKKDCKEAFDAIHTTLRELRDMIADGRH